jgi:hypothetical protein
MGLGTKVRNRIERRIGVLHATSCAGDAFDLTDLLAALDEAEARAAKAERERDELSRGMSQTCEDAMAIVRGEVPQEWAWPLHAIRDRLNKLTARAEKAERERDAARQEHETLRAILGLDRMSPWNPAPLNRKAAGLDEP